MTPRLGRLRAGAFFVAAAASAAGIVLSALPSDARRAVATGSVSGTLGNAAPGYGPAEDLTTLREATGITVTTPDGKNVGVVHVATKPVGGVIPFTVDRLPLGVALRVAASRTLSGAPSPVPRGFFHMFQVERKHPDENGASDYTVTLTAANPTAKNLDFVANPIEVFPEPSTPAPSPNAPASARP